MGSWGKLGLALALALVAGCSAPEVATQGLDPARTRIVHAHGFVIVHDSLDYSEETALFAELADSRAKILALLKKNAAPGDFRTWDERKKVAACPAPSDPATPPEVRVLVQRNGARCHADETGITILKAHVARRDATHELVHYLAGGSWRPVDEGLAVYLTEKLWGPAGGIPVDIRARVYLDLNMEESIDRERLEHDMDRRDYDVAASFVKFLIEEKGWDRFLELYRGAPGDYHTIYGSSEQELAAIWRQRVKALEVRQSSAYYRFKDYLTNLRNR